MNLKGVMTVIERVKPQRCVLAWAPVAVGLLALAVSGCGGGGNESGPADGIEASPAEVRVGKQDQCVVGQGPTVYVYGGRPPYKLSNSVPTGMALSRSVLQNSGDGFTITFINGVCMKSMPINIEDDMGRLSKVLVSNGA